MIFLQKSDVSYVKKTRVNLTRVFLGYKFNLFRF